MAHKKRKKKTPSISYFEAEGKYWHCIHHDEVNAWIVEFDKGRKNCGGGVKKVALDFFKSRELLILAI